jgi:hypothetical protein
MRMQRLAIALTVVNLLILVSGLFRVEAVTAAQDVPMLRGRGLELVDEQGRRRAQIIIMPPSTTPDGHKSEGTVLFRLIDVNGRPGVKIGTSQNGSGISLAGDSERREWNGVQVLADSTGSVVKLTNKDGRVQLIKP